MAAGTFAMIDMTAFRFNVIKIYATSKVDLRISYSMNLLTVAIKLARNLKKTLISANIRDRNLHRHRHTQ